METAATSVHGTLAVFGAALVTCGAAYGIGKIGAAAMDSIARQPEMASKIQTAMLIAAALIEGVALFATVICFLGITA
jgi:F-type H+-transporting ATPase subunit c